MWRIARFGRSARLKVPLVKPRDVGPAIFAIFLSDFKSPDVAAASAFFIFTLASHSLVPFCRKCIRRPSRAARRNQSGG